MTYQDDVKLFMWLGGQEYADELTEHPTVAASMAEDVITCAAELHQAAVSWTRWEQTPQALSARLLVEEVEETLIGIVDGEIEEIADGLVDIVYIVMGIANRYGIDFDACWSAVHSANVAKFPFGKAERDASGKILKPEGWTPPDIAGALGIK